MWPSIGAKFLERPFHHREVEVGQRPDNDGAQWQKGDESTLEYLCASDTRMCGPGVNQGLRDSDLSESDSHLPVIARQHHILHGPVHGPYVCTGMLCLLGHHEQACSSIHRRLLGVPGRFTSAQGTGDVGGGRGRAGTYPGRDPERGLLLLLAGRAKPFGNVFLRTQDRVGLPPATGNSQGHRAHNLMLIYPARHGCKSKWRAERGPGESCVRAG